MKTMTKSTIVTMIMTMTTMTMKTMTLTTISMTRGRSRSRSRNLSASGAGNFKNGRLRQPWFWRSLTKKDNVKSVKYEI